MDETRIWTGLGVVDTIYEDEDEDEICSVSRSVSPSSTPLRSRVESWTLATGHEEDVKIHVQNSSFCLHKEPLALRSRYLKRHLKRLSQFTLSPPLKITAETFTLVAEFCYGAHPVITPFNVASLRIAAELLEMTETNGALDDNLYQKTEAYFDSVVSVNYEYVSVVIETCFSLLPEVETASDLLSRCIEALSLTEDSDCVMRCLSDVKYLRARDFELVLESMNQRLTGSHDPLYQMVDLYLKEHNGNITEEQKIKMCNYIDCTSLSPQRLMHAVQNPIMPLRFIVQAMFVEQLNTRRSIVRASDRQVRNHHQPAKDSVTLGAILQRDAALRQAAQLKAAMDATSSRIQSLEKELCSMRELLHESSSIRSSTVDSGRSASCRFVHENKIERPICYRDSGQSASCRFGSGNGRIGSFHIVSDNGIEKGQIGSISSGNFRLVSSKDGGEGGVTSSSEESFDFSPRLEKTFGRRLMNGVKSALRIPNFLSKKKSESKSSINVTEDEGKVKGEERNNEDVVVIKKNTPFHRRSRSQS